MSNKHIIHTAKGNLEKSAEQSNFQGSDPHATGSHLTRPRDKDRAIFPDGGTGVIQGTQSVPKICWAKESEPFPKVSNINIQDILSLHIMAHLAPKIACASPSPLC